MSEKRINLRYRQRRATLFGVLLLLIAIPVIYSTDEQIVGCVLGWLILASSLWLIGKVDRAALDDSGEHLVHQRGFIVPFLNKRFPRHKITGVRVGKRTEGRGDDRRTRFPVTLRGVSGSRLLDHGDLWFARVTAERLARLLNVPLDNRIWGELSRREAHETDMPLVERWRRDGTVFEKPPLPSGTPLREEQVGDRYSVSFPADLPILRFAVIGLFAASIPAIVDIGAAEFFHSLGYRILAGFLTILAIFMMAFIGRSGVTIDAQWLTYRQGMFILRQRLRIEEIEEMFVQFDGMGFIGDTSAVWIGWTDSKQANEYLASVVPYHLARMGASIR